MRKSRSSPPDFRANILTAPIAFSFRIRMAIGLNSLNGERRIRIEKFPSGDKGEKIIFLCLTA